MAISGLLPGNLGVLFITRKTLPATISVIFSNVARKNIFWVILTVPQYFTPYSLALSTFLSPINHVSRNKLLFDDSCPCPFVSFVIIFM